MITVEQAQDVLPAGARVRDRWRDRWGIVAVRTAGVGAGQVYDTDVSGHCCSVNVLWDGGTELWTNPTDLARVKEFAALDLTNTLNAAMAEFGEGLDRMRRVSEATSAMAEAYRGDIDALRATLTGLPGAQLAAIAEAAALLAREASAVQEEA